MHGLGLLTLRLTISAVFVAHGLPKLVAVWGGSPAHAGTLLEAAGVAAAYPVAVGTGLVEVLAGGLLAAGAYTLLAAALLTATIAATSWLLHLFNGFFLNWSLESGVEHGYEFDLVRLGVLVCLILAGPGTLAYDTRRTRARRLHGRQKKG